MISGGIDADIAEIFAEADLGRWPEIGRRLPEDRAIAGKCPLVPLLELAALLFPALGGAVVHRSSEDLAAESIPVRTRIEQVQVPYLIDLIGWRHRMARN